jgi:hypothetical protein
MKENYYGTIHRLLMAVGTDNSSLTKYGTPTGVRNATSLCHDSCRIFGISEDIIISARAPFYDHCFLHHNPLVFPRVFQWSSSYACRVNPVIASGKSVVASVSPYGT